MWLNVHFLMMQMKSGLLYCKMWFILVFMSSWKFLQLFLNTYCAVSFSLHQNASYQKDICQTLIIAFCSRIMQQLFMQDEFQTSIDGPAGLLHWSQHMMQKSDDCIHRTYSSDFGSQKGKEIGYEL